MSKHCSTLGDFFRKLQNDSIRLVDLSHALHDKIPTWTGACGYQKKNLLNYGEDLFCVQEMTLFGGSGTHLDAPSHLFPGHSDVSSIQLKDLFAPVCIIDVRAQVALDPQYALSCEDIDCFQTKHGPIPNGAVVIAFTGWSKYWQTPEQYQNLDSHQIMRFPRIRAEALKGLLPHIKGVGIDTLSPDGGDISNGFPVHDLILAQGGYILENLRNLESMPPVGGYLMTAPLKIAEGTEAPVRVVGFLDQYDTPL